MTIKAVLFDLDGTLLDSAPDFIVTIEQLAIEYKVPIPTPESIRQQVSNGARALVNLVFHLKEGDPGFDERRQRLLDIYEETMGKYCILFPGMDKLIQTLADKKIAWGIITNKPVRFAEPIISQLSLPQAPALLLCPDHVEHAKPHPEALFLACKKLDCTPAEVIYVGDHKRDIDCGRSAGSKTIAVSFGYIHEDDDMKLWQADYIARDTDEIWTYIQSQC